MKTSLEKGFTTHQAPKSEDRLRNPDTITFEQARLLFKDGRVFGFTMFQSATPGEIYERNDTSGDAVIWYLPENVEVPANFVITMRRGVDGGIFHVLVVTEGDQQSVTPLQAARIAGTPYNHLRELIKARPSPNTPFALKKFK